MEVRISRANKLSLFFDFYLLIISKQKSLINITTGKKTSYEKLRANANKWKTNLKNSLVYIFQLLPVFTEKCNLKLRFLANKSKSSIRGMKTVRRTLAVLEKLGRKRTVWTLYVFRIFLKTIQCRKLVLAVLEKVYICAYIYILTNFYTT